MKKIILLSVITILLSSYVMAEEESLTFPDGSKYVGEFKDGKRHGQGTMTWSNGEKYAGQWEDDKRHGQGTFTSSVLPDEDRYGGRKVKDDEEDKDGMFTLSGLLYIRGGYGVRFEKEYVGQWKDDKRHGEGTFTSSFTLPDKDSGYRGREKVKKYENEKYVGQWEDDKRHGQGTFTLSGLSDEDTYNGSKVEKDEKEYVGQWKDDKRHGEGTFTSSFTLLDRSDYQRKIEKYENKKYEGQWEDDKSHGQGTFTSSFTFSNEYSGYGDRENIKNDKKEKYVGQWEYGKYHGDGTLTLSDEDSEYVGQFKYGKKNGEGTRTYPDGSRYEGQWMDDKHNGAGTMTFPDGSKYVGQFKDGNENGYGTMYNSSGTIYQKGIFENGKYIGQYEGQLKDGLPNGQGTVTLSNGEKYVGQWEDGKKHGWGTMYDSSGTIYQKGFFKNGELSAKYEGQWKDGLPNGEGTLTFSYEDSEYVGHWKDGLPHGQGTIYQYGEIYQKGTFRNGEYVGKSDEKPVEAPKNKLGELIGTIGGFEGNDVVVNGKKDTISRQAPIGQALIVDANGKYIYLQSIFPMQTVVKCKVTSGDRTKIKKGMKVYLKP